MFLTEKLRSAQREAAERVARGRSYSLALPIVGRVPVPSPEQLAIYAALGGLAVLELIDWPVIGVVKGWPTCKVVRLPTGTESR